MSSSATVRVEKATSDLLIGPDWTINIDICDSININHGEAKDVVKAVKKRVQHKNPKVQLLALTLLETMVKNCGDYVHFLIVEKNILQEMTKIVKKNADMRVRDKILVLLDSWQEAFGGPGGKYPQYYWACEELRRCGISFPRRSADAAPIFTPPVTHPSFGNAQVGFGMPIHSSKRLDEAMTSETESLSLSGLDSMRNIMELLAEMLQTINPSDRLAAKDELIVDLASQCRANQKKLMQMLTSTGDEELLGRGLELNDSLQNLLAKHDAIASGSPLPPQVKDIGPHQTEVGPSGLKPPEVGESSSGPNPTTSLPVAAVTKLEVEEEEEDDFDQLARRHSKAQAMPSAGATNGNSGSVVSSNTSNPTISSSAPIPTASNALALPDPLAPVRTTKEQDLIELLSITLSTTSNSPHTPSNSNQNIHQASIPPSTQSSPFASQNYPGNLGPVTNTYVVPWAHTQTSPQPQPEVRLQPQPQPEMRLQPQPQPQPQPQQQPRPQPQATLRYPQQSSGYIPPPWAATPGYLSNQNPAPTANMFSTPRTSTTASYMPMQAARPLQQFNSFPARGSNGWATHGDAQVNPRPGNPVPAAVHKPFIPSYRLFEDLNVLGNVDGKVKATNASSSMSMLGSSGQGMVGGKKSSF